MRLGFLAKILPPPENRFYDHFEDGAEVVQLSAYLFYQIVHSVPEERDACLVHAKSYKKRASDIQDQCLTLLDKSFITPINDRDRKSVV